MPPHFARLGTLVFIFTLLCFSGWRLSNSGLVSDTNIGNLSGSGHIIDSHGEYIQGVSPPIHDNSHKHDPTPGNAKPTKPTLADEESLDPDQFGSDLGVGDGSKGKQLGDNRIYVTVTVTQMDTKTIYRDQPGVTEAPVPDDGMQVDRTTATGTSTINRDFERYAGLVEDYKKSLTAEDQKVLGKLEARSTRQERIMRMYDLDGAEQWMKFIQDQDDSAMPPLTKFTQEFLYKWQHPDPEDCKNRKFLVLHHNWDGNGLGTVVHGTGWVLGLAIRLNRILIYNDDKSPGENFIEKGCMQDGRRSLDCLFESFSSCSSHRDLVQGNHIKLRSYWKIPPELDMSTSAVPPILGQALKNYFPDMHYDAIKYWWRAQSAAYMMRMNGPALKRLKALRLEEGMHNAKTHDEAGKLVDVKVPYPMPDGSFSMHIRHGDKGIEMELIPFSKYVDIAEQFAAMNMIMARKVCFLSTEDESVFEEAQTIGNGWISPNTTSNENWTWIWSNIPRINGGPVEQLNKFGNRTEMTIKWMQQLFFAIEAPYILGTRGSGWNRMIDELRCIWVDCRTPYMEVGPFEDWVHYNF